MTKKVCTLSIFLGFVVFMGGFGTSMPIAMAAQTNVMVKVRIMVAKKTSLPIYSSYSGTIIATNQVRIASRLMGYVRKIDVHVGQQVKRGRRLLTVDQADVNSAIHQARAGVSKARAALAAAGSNFKRYQALYEQKAVPRQQFQQFQLAYRVARSDYKVALSVLQNALSQLKYSEVRAPFAGAVISKRVDTGQLITPGQTLLVLQSTGLQVEIQVDMLAFDHLHLGRTVVVIFKGSGSKSRTVNGVVERLVSAADPMTHTHLVKIGLPADCSAFPGEYVTVHIIVGQTLGILIPDSAIYTRAGITGVFVVTDTGSAAFRMVRPGSKISNRIVILSGLVSGDRVIIKARGMLYNGVKIEGSSV